MSGESVNGYMGYMALFLRDVKVGVRQRAQISHPLLFSMLAGMLFVLAAEPDPQFLQKIAPSVLWVILLFAILLGLNHLFREDYENGFLAQILLSPRPTTLLVLTKVCAHWFVSVVPLLMVAPLLAVMFNLSVVVLPELMLGLVLGSLAMGLIGALGRALTLAAHSGETLLPLLILPLYLPILIFATSSVRVADSTGVGIGANAPLLGLGAILLGALALAPVGITQALRISLD